MSGIYESTENLFICSPSRVFLNRISESVTCMCLLFDRSILACGTTKGEIRVFDAQDQFCQVDSFSSHENAITYLYYIAVSLALPPHI